MEVTIKEKEGFERAITVRIEAKRVDELIGQELGRLSAQVNLPGFRPGKTPVKLLESRYKDHINGSVAEQLIQESYAKALTENKANPADRPTMEVGQVVRGEDFSYTATFEQIPEVNPEGYKGLSLSRITATVEESDVDKVIEQIREQNTKFEVEEGRVAQSGDQVKLDFDGSIDGVPFNGGKAEGHELVLGSGQFIPGFEDQVIGAKAESDVDVTVNFPDNYQADHLAGKEALFKCRIHEVRAPVAPEVNDDLAVKAGIQEGGVAKLREEIAAKLKTEADGKSESEVKKSILDQILKANPIEIPRSLIKREQEGMVEQLKQEYKRQGVDPAMLNMKDEDLAAGFEKEAAKRVKVGMLLGAIARVESIEATEEAVDAFLDSMTASYGDQASAMRKWMKEDPERLEGVRSTVLETAIIDWIVNNGTVEEKSSTLEELMSQKEDQDDQEA
ncbi:MAG: trigger factor [Magnetococcales bacterium]|nr:trigger factor [Magnetococcales bacterium]